MPNLGPSELIIIGLILVLLFGATRLPQTAKGIGQALKIFKKELRDDEQPQAQPEAPAAQQNTTPPQAISQGNQTNGSEQTARQPAEDAEHTGR